MQYSYCSMRDVIGKVIRNTRVQDTSYIADAHTWIYEAMEMMETQQTLKGKWVTLKVYYHKAKLPCGVRWIDAVECNGRRLKEGGGARPASKDRRYLSAADELSVYQSSVKQVETVENHIVYTTEIKKVEELPLNTMDYYYTEMGFLNTSFEKGEVTIYYRAVPVDEDDLPLIPDNQNYKQALYWYCRAMMIGAGFEDKVFTYEQCFSQFENLYMPRAISEIRMPSPEQMERRVANLSRFIPPAGYYDSFFGAQPAEAFMDF